MNIYQRILKVMKDVGYVQNDGETPHYKYPTHDKVIGLLRPAFIEHGIAVIPRITNRVRDGNTTEIDIEVDLVNAEKPEDRVMITSFGYGIDSSDKGPGKAISYAFKYAMLKAFCLETGDDPEQDSIDAVRRTDTQKTKLAMYEALPQSLKKTISWLLARKLGSNQMMNEALVQCNGDPIAMTEWIERHFSVIVGTEISSDVRGETDEPI